MGLMYVFRTFEGGWSREDLTYSKPIVFNSDERFVTKDIYVPIH